jgi:adenylate cyclase
VVFWGCGLLLVGLQVGLFLFIQRASQETVNEGATRQRETAMATVERSVKNFLDVPKARLRELQARFAARECSIDDGRTVESCLTGALLSDPRLEAVTLTHATRTGFDEDNDGMPVLEPEGRWQLMVFRQRAGPDSPICARWVEKKGDQYRAHTTCRAQTGLLLQPTPSGADEEVTDPTEQDGFRWPAGKGWDNKFPTLSDLSWFEADQNLPPMERRAILSTVNSMLDNDGNLLGVLKVNMAFDELSETIRTTKVNPEPDDPFHVFLTDADGRLITGFAPKDRAVDADEDSIRVDLACATDEIRAALKSGMIDQITRENLAVNGVIQSNGAPYLASFLGLRGTQSWAIGLVGPADFYQKKVNRTQRAMLILTSIVLAVVVLLSLLSLRAVASSLRRIVDETGRMQRFDFARHDAHSSLADVQDALMSLERAKTAVRAMGRYVPLELVRRLFREDKEPEPGGTMREVTVMFTDIEGFTTIVEKEPPDRVAAWLGQYLSVMTGAVHALYGTVDKFIGDAVMAVWNAPIDDADHVEHACRAALRCVADAQALFASSAWEGRPPLVTRFGLHVTSAMVGNFGAPDRLSYTAIGDGVNLASRLEGLNKEYGTGIIVSEAIVQRVKDKFVFRRLDKVAVKGKAQAIEVYELVGEAGAAKSATHERYEEALGAYFRREFERAASLLNGGTDKPSAVLKSRCAEMLRTPPPADWNGVWTLHTK